MTSLPRATRTAGPLPTPAAPPCPAEAEAEGAAVGTVRRWKRDTSPPVVKVVLLSIGRFAKADRSWRSWAGLVPCGTLTSPDATARSSSDLWPRVERGDRDTVPML